MALPRRLPEVRAPARRRELEPRQLVTPETPDEPPSARPRRRLGARLLDEAEEIINTAGPEILAEVHAEQARKGGGLRRIFRRKR